MDAFLLSTNFKIWLLCSILWILREILLDKFLKRNPYNNFFRFFDSTLMVVGVVLFIAFFVIIVL